MKRITMEISLDTLLTGKATKIRNREYLSTAEYVTPFLDKMAEYTTNFIVNVKLPEQISLAKDEENTIEDLVYNRVWIQAVLPDEMGYPNHKEVINLLYALDARKPVAKIAKTALNCACLNMCVFSPDFLNIQDIEPQNELNLSCVDPLMEKQAQIGEWLSRLANTTVAYNEESINRNLGSWVRHTLNDVISTDAGKVKLSSSTAIDAYNLLYTDEKSDYFVKPGTPTDMFNIYNAFTYLISNQDSKDIVNKVEKILLLKRILEI